MKRLFVIFLPLFLVAIYSSQKQQLPPEKSSRVCSKHKPPVVTQKEYQQIQTDMTLGEIETLVGEMGEHRGISETSDSYLWLNPDGTGVLAVMDHKYGRLVRKSRIGKLK